MFLKRNNSIFNMGNYSNSQIVNIVKYESELENIANILKNNIRSDKENIISRVMIIYEDSVRFSNGRMQKNLQYATNFNKEIMPNNVNGNVIYSSCNFEDISPNNINEMAIARDLSSQSRNYFPPKLISLPNEEHVHCERIPSNYEHYDAELMEFSKLHPNTVLSRELTIDQRIIVNSNGGKVIQSIPFFSINYNSGFLPVNTSRNLSVVTNSDDDIKKFSGLIKYIADPTPDHRIKRSKNFTDAFLELDKVSKLKQGYLKDLGIPTQTLYDVVMLTGVPVHEIFGHHFEEPVQPLNPGLANTFSQGQILNNKNITLSDDPNKLIDGFRVFGHTKFDAYGRIRPKRVHIQDGLIKDFLGSEYVDQEKLMNFMGVEKSEYIGNASQYIRGCFPQPRMSCTVLNGKTENIDLENKIVCVAHEGSTNLQTKTYEVRGREAYVIREGEPVRVLPIKISGGINQALENLVLLNDISFQTGYCGKSNPVSPEIESRVPVSQVANSQFWKDQQVYSQPVSEQQLKILSRKDLN